MKTVILPNTIKDIVIKNTLMKNNSLFDVEYITLDTFIKRIIQSEDNLYIWVTALHANAACPSTFQTWPSDSKSRWMHTGRKSHAPAPVPTDAHCLNIPLLLPERG